MCGIVGYIGKQKATPILLNGLSALEYRGYDSAGIAVLEKDNICVLKDKGRVKNLYDIEGINNLESTIGIAHTRWATHGKPSKENSHPHTDNSNTFAVVHNGIIENFTVLKEFLISKGYHFFSETDTEVIPNLIHYYYYNNIDDDDRFLRAVKSACDDLKGSYAPKHEFILYGHKGRCLNKSKRLPDVINCDKVKSKDMVHSTEKPIELLTKFINMSTNENDVILDCFMGSGSTGVASLNTNRKFIGIELDDKYFDIAKQRIEEAKNNQISFKLGETYE